VIRISGQDAFSIVASCLDKGEHFSAAAPRRIALYGFVGTARGNGPLIDRVTAVKYCAPRSYTGENMVEIICHGGMAIVERILEQLMDAGAEYAKRGEFTRRAFLNGKMDLVGAEAVQQMVSSRTAAEHRNAAINCTGGYRPLLEKWRRDVERLLVEIEYAIEFGEEESAGSVNHEERISERVSALHREVSAELERREIMRRYEGCVEIAFVGPPNAGKSTLMNLVLGYERSIVFSEAGTTRDAVSETMSWRGMDVRFVDCAGLRAVGEGIERMGVERSWEFVDASDVVVLVTAADDSLKSEEREVVSRRAKKGLLVGVVNKVDLERGEDKRQFFERNGIPFVCAAAIRRDQRSLVVDFLSAILEGVRGQLDEVSILCTKRQEAIAKKISEELFCMEAAEENTEEIMAVHARNVLELLDEFVGRSTPEEVLNTVFEQFCVGK
jgi:tRNA modification GTPase